MYITVQAQNRMCGSTPHTKYLFKASSTTGGYRCTPMVRLTLSQYNDSTKKSIKLIPLEANRVKYEMSLLSLEAKITTNLKLDTCSHLYTKGKRAIKTLDTHEKNTLLLKAKYDHHATYLCVPQIIYVTINYRKTGPVHLCTKRKKSILPSKIKQFSQNCRFAASREAATYYSTRNQGISSKIIDIELTSYPTQVKREQIDSTSIPVLATPLPASNNTNKQGKSADKVPTLKYEVRKHLENWATQNSTIAKGTRSRQVNRQSETDIEPKPSPGKLNLARSSLKACKNTLMKLILTPDYPYLKRHTQTNRQTFKKPKPNSNQETPVPKPNSTHTNPNQPRHTHHSKHYADNMPTNSGAYKRARSEDKESNVAKKKAVFDPKESADTPKVSGKKPTAAQKRKMEAEAKAKAAAEELPDISEEAASQVDPSNSPGTPEFPGMAQTGQYQGYIVRTQVQTLDPISHQVKTQVPKLHHHPNPAPQDCNKLADSPLNPILQVRPAQQDHKRDFRI